MKEGNMKKEEILEKARKENKQKDFAVIEAERKGCMYAAISILILSTIYYASGIFLTGKTNYGWYSIIALYCTVVYGFKGIKTKNKTNIITSIIWLLVTILTTYSYFEYMIKSSTIL